MSLDLLTISFADRDAPKQFEQSLRSSGFAVLRDHPIPLDIISSVYDEWKIFFSTDLKFDFPFDVDKQDGYFPFLSENAKGSNAKDLKEFYHIYPWGRMPNSIGPSTMDLFNALKDVASTLLEWLQSCSPESVNQLFSMRLKDMIENSESSLLRVIHYPPMSGNENTGSIRAAAHEDINLLTMLVAGSEPGLQVLDLDGQWHDVSCDQDTIIVNSGDMLKMASGGYYPSTTHQVINPKVTENVSRYSIPLFLHPRDEVILSESHTAESFLRERLEEIGLK